MSKKKKSPQSRSVITKVTIWYSMLVFLLISLVVGGAYLISGAWSEGQAENELREKVVELSHDLDDFESFDDGIYFSLYDDSGAFIQGSLPDGFNQSVTLVDGKSGTVSFGQQEYQYRDVYLSGRWLRGVRVKSAVSRELQFFLLSLVIVSPVFLMVMTFGGYSILKRSFGPVETMTQTARLISEKHDYTKRIDVPNGNDEISRLAQTFNQMLSSIDESFAREKQFTNNASHELRTPIAIIMAESEFGRKYATSLEESVESHEIIYRQADLMKQMVEQILELTRMEQVETKAFQKLSLSALVEQYLSDNQRVFDDRKLILEAKIGSELWINGDNLLLGRLLDNLISNAIKFTRDKITITLEEKPQEIILSISDNGIGISEEHLDKIWDKFYQVNEARTKSTVLGTGLGLSLVANIARLHGASYAITSQVNEGACVTIRFPKAME